MPTNQLCCAPTIIGLMPRAAQAAAGTSSLNGAGNWVAMGFVTDQAKTLSKVRMYVVSKNSNPADSDISCSLYSDTSSAPGSVVEVSTTVSPSLANATWCEWSGFTTALSAQRLYWIVWKNLNATPTTKYITLNVGGSGGGQGPWLHGGQISTLYGWIRKLSTDGATWSGGGGGVYGMRIEFSDGSFMGFPASTFLFNSASSTSGVYSTREHGAIFTTPATAYLRARGILYLASITGTPTGSIRGRLYTGSSLTATTNSVPTTETIASTQGINAVYFTSTQVIAPSTQIRVVLGETSQSDTTSNCIKLAEYTIDSNANSLARLPFGSWQKTYYDGSSWAETSTLAPAIALILDSDREF